MIDLSNPSEIQGEIRARYMKEFYDALNGCSETHPSSVLAHKRKVL